MVLFRDFFYPLGETETWQKKRIPLQMIKLISDIADIFSEAKEIIYNLAK